MLIAVLKIRWTSEIRTETIRLAKFSLVLVLCFYLSFLFVLCVWFALLLIRGIENVANQIACTNWNLWWLWRFRFVYIYANNALMLNACMQPTECRLFAHSIEDWCGFFDFDECFCLTIGAIVIDPSWASINRGILLCAECCSIHRSLGRHISQVKSLRQGSWSPAVLNYVNAINAHGANSVWEHCLMDAVAPKNLKRKPSPKDPLHPTKAEFIRAKHVNLSFILKPNLQVDGDGGPVNVEAELSKQLHASVRSANLETSLRLLVQGADPNYFNEVRSLALRKSTFC